MKKYIYATASITHADFEDHLYEYLTDVFGTRDVELTSKSGFEAHIKHVDSIQVEDAIKDFAKEFNYTEEKVTTIPKHDILLSSDKLTNSVGIDITPDDFNGVYVEVFWTSSTQTSQVSFDFDLGDDYDQNALTSELEDIFEDMGLDAIGIDFRSVEYPMNKTYSQCGIDFKWSGYYNEMEIEEDIANLIEDEGGNFLGMDFNSYEG